jgi:hypothetical protein
MKDQVIEQSTAQLAATTSEVMLAIKDAFPEVAGQGFAMYVNYIVASGAAAIAINGPLLLLAVVLIYIALRLVVQDTPKDNSGPVILCTVLGGSLLFISLVNLYFGTLCLLAPEGYIINTIIEGALNK